MFCSDGVVVGLVLSTREGSIFLGFSNLLSKSPQQKEGLTFNAF